MSIIWGSWKNTSSNGMRVGYRVSRTSVSSGSSSVKFTVRIYTQNKYPFSDNQYITYGSYLGSNTSFHNGSSGGAVHRATKTYTYSYSDWGRSRTLTSRATVGGVWSGLTPTVAIRLAVPARPYRTPYAPTGLEITSQVSSGALWLNWNNRSSSGTGRPYTSQRIEYNFYQSNGSWTGWKFLATVSSSAEAYRYASMYSNTRYRYRVRANNSAGSSSWSAPVDAYTVPAAPTGARASVESTGDSIRVTWTGNNRYNWSVIAHQVQRQTSSGGSWSTVASRLSASTSSWVDTSPNAGYNRYRVRSFVDTSLITQYSGWSTAPSITTIVPPAAPTGVTVSPRVPDFTLDTVVSWQHNHGGDGASQTEYIIGYSTDEGETWDELTAETSSQQATIPAETVANGVTVLFRVRTRGNRTETFGPWSQHTQVDGWTTPTVTIDEDMPAEIVQTIPFDVAWTYNQDENRSQLSAVVEVWTVDADGELVERVVRDSVTGDAAQHEITEVLNDGAEYVVRVRATSSREQISAWAEVTVTIDLLPPARVDLRPQYDHETGVMVLEVEPHEPRRGHLVGVNPLAGMGHDYETVLQQETAPPAGTHYAWLGERHASESIMLDGDGNETARNYIYNSNFSQGSSNWTTQNGDITYANNAVILAEVNGRASIYQSARTRIPDATDETPVSSTIRVRGHGEVEIRFGGSNGRYIISETIDTDEYVTLKGTGVAYGNDNIIIYYYGDKSMEVECFQLEHAENASDYFDGSTASDRAHDLWYNSDGVPHEWVNGTNGEPGGWMEARDVPVLSEQYRDLDIELDFTGDPADDDQHVYRWAGEPGNSVALKYEIDRTDDETAITFEAGVDTFDVQRSIDNSEWITILAGVDATQVDEGYGDEARVISLMDLLPTISGTNEYRLLLRSVAPSTGHTSTQTVSIGPPDNRGWAFLNYGPNMGNVLRVGNKLSIDEPISQTGENVLIQGRSRPISLYGEHESRSLSVSGVLYHDEPAQAPSAGSPLDSPPNDWRRAQREANTVCIRTPLGHRIYGRLAGVDFGSEQLNLTSLSFTVEENDFREEESSGAGVEVVS